MPPGLPLSKHVLRRGSGVVPPAASASVQMVSLALGSMPAVAQLLLYRRMHRAHAPADSHDHRSCMVSDKATCCVCDAPDPNPSEQPLHYCSTNASARRASTL